MLAIMFLSVVSPSMCPRVSVEETQKGWVRDPISSGGKASSARLWKAAWKDQRASPEGATGPYCAAAAAAPWPNSPGACSLLLLACSAVYFGRTFNPVQPSKISAFSLFVCQRLSLFSPLNHVLFSPKAATMWQKSFTNFPSLYR